MNPTTPCRGHAAESERAEGIEAAIRMLRLFIMGESLLSRKQASKHLEALVAECDRLTNIIANPMLHGMNIRDGAVEMALEGPGPALLAGMFVGLLDRFPDAQNYVECSFSSALGPITVTVQKPGGKTPHALRVEAETELAASRAECARLSSMLDHQRDEATETERMLRSELETERIRLAACGVVALSNTPESAAKARNMLPEFRSASCDDVARMVDEQMQLRADLDAAREREARPMVSNQVAEDFRHFFKRVIAVIPFENYREIGELGGAILEQLKAAPSNDTVRLQPYGIRAKTFDPAFVESLAEPAVPAEVPEPSTRNRESTASEVKALMDNARRQMYELLTGEAHLAPATPAEILDDAQRLIKRAQRAGVVLTIETVSIPPWAMGRYAMRPSTRPARQPAEKQA